MKALFVDCSNGLAGDMLLAAFLDAGVPMKVFEDPILAMGLGKSFSFSIKEGHSLGIRGLRVGFEGLRAESSTRSFEVIAEMVNQFSWKESIRNKVLNVFRCLAEAEASVHGKAIDKVHFHELGKLDALIEVACICSAVEYLNPVQVVCSIPPAGSGMVKTSHGLLPVPVPVVLELAKKFQINLLAGENYPKSELTTPTGLAIMAVLANKFGQPDSFSIENIGIGLGSRTFDRANFLRVCISKDIELVPSSLQKGFNWQSLTFQEAWIDDATPEDIASLTDELRSAGAIEVVSHPVNMKKGRLGFAVKVIVKTEDAKDVRLVWFSKGTTIGLRERLEGRWVLSRRLGTCPSPFGKICVKQVQRPDGSVSIKPEHDELVRISNDTGKSIDEIRSALCLSNDNFLPSEDWSC